MARITGFCEFYEFKVTRAAGLGLLRCLSRPRVLYGVKNDAELAGE
jgi:hypothetical protein